MSQAQSGGPDRGPATSDDGAQPDQSGPGGTGLSRDDAFELLSSRRRRYILHYLQVETASTLPDLAEQVAAWENETDIAQLSSSQRKAVYTSLQQFHLPKMDDAGIVAFDQEAGEVRLTDTARDLDIYLEVVDRYDIPWSGYYLGFSAVGAVLVSLSWLGVAPFAAVPAAGWTVFLLTALFVSSASHYALARRNRLGTGEAPPELTDP